jgi:thymidylate synthase (FAD)
VIILTGPSVRLLSQPAFAPHPKYEVPGHEHGAESLIATAGKVCYDSYGLDGNPVKQHVENLMRSGHHSVVEHVHVGVFIEGITRGCSHEIVRHRMFNYSQRSTRYTAEEDAAIVLDPWYAEIFRLVVSDSEVESAKINALNEFVDSARRAIDDYRSHVKNLEQLAPIAIHPRERRKWCRGKARQLLPHALETRMVMTGNLRAWRHFFLMRTARGAEAEIRRLAGVIFDLVEPLAPSVFAGLDREVVGGIVELTERLW